MTNEDKARLVNMAKDAQRSAKQAVSKADDALRAAHSAMADADDLAAAVLRLVSES